MWQLSHLNGNPNDGCYLELQMGSAARAIAEIVGPMFDGSNDQVDQGCNPPKELSFALVVACAYPDLVENKEAR